MSARGYEHAVRMENTQMAFGNVIALKNVNFEVGANEIVGLIGDNGAGKSTLIKIVTGVLKPTAGRLYIRDRPVDPERYSVQDAHDLRIEAVHQEKSLADKQPLWRNMFVGRQITNKLGFIDVRREKELANRMLLEQIGFRGAGIDADSTVGDLSGGERQGISIGRAMYFDADLIILDEPTVALALKEVQKVLDFVRGIKKSGRAAIYIEHNLAHVHELADRLVVLDRGEVVSEIRQGEMSLAELTRHLLDVQAAREGATGP
jgi:simple sugar transport system ATP-binding protein